MTVRSVGILGFGRFGSLLAHAFASDFEIRVYDTRQIHLHETIIAEKRIHATSLQDTLRSDCVFFCVPIVAFEHLMQEATPMLPRETVVLDVCSVKMYPEQVMKRYLGETATIVPTHPMFGPDSAKNGWTGLPFVLCPSTAPTSQQQAAVEFWRDYLTTRHGCNVVEMTCEEHDRTTAYNLCLTQLLGRVLGNIGIKPSPIDAQSFRYLLQMKEISYNDSLELLMGLHKFNPFAAEMRERLRMEFERLEPFLQAEFDMSTLSAT